MVKFNSSMIGNLLSFHRHMHNSLVNFQRIQDICKQFAANRINEHGNVSRCEVVPTFSDSEVIALSLTAEAFRTSSSKDWQNLPRAFPILYPEERSIPVANSQLPAGANS